MLRRFVLLIAFTFPLAIFAQEKPKLSLEDAVALARKNAFAVATAKAEVNRAKGVVNEAKAAALPYLSLNGTYTRYDKEQTANINGNDIIIRPIDQKLISLSLNMPIDITGVYGLAISGAWALVHAASFQLAATMNDAALDAKSAFYSVIKAEDLVWVADESLANATKRLEVAKKKVGVGVSARFDVIKAETDVAAAQQERIRAGNALDLAKADLNNILARDPSTDFDIVRPEGLPKLQSDLKTLTEQAKTARPEIAAQKMQLEYRIKYRQARERGSLPTLTVSARRDHNPDAGGFGAQADSATAVATLSIPIFEGGKTRAQVQQARQDEQMARIQLQQTTLAIELEVRQAFLNLETAAKVIEVAEANVVSAKESLRVATLRFENDIGTQLEVSDAEVQLAKAESNLAAARFDYRNAWARMQRAIGKEEIQ